jgi:Divergent InlB B-repeat domain
MRIVVFATLTAVAMCFLASSAAEPLPDAVTTSISLTGQPPPVGFVARPALDWCGAGQPAVFNRTPDADLSAIRQVHVSYVIPTDAPDRVGSRAGPIATDVAAIDSWWRGQDSGRTIRFDRYAFAGCTTRFGALDIGFVRLPRSGSQYLGAEGLDRLFQDFTQPATLPWHKHLVYYDGPNPFDESVCGTTLTSRVTRGVGGRDGVSFVWLDSACAVDLGAGGLVASVAVHELIHGLGALSEGSAHECAPPNRGHVCDSTSDILMPFATSETRLATQVLDVNRDDYYTIPSGSLFDVEDSGWLSHLPQFPIQVTASGSEGTIRMSSPSNFNCGRGCSFEVDVGATVTLIAMPGAGSRLVRWSGACSGRGACDVTVDQAKTATALFAPAAPVRLTVAVAGKGRVVSTPAGISCPRRCSATFAAGTNVRLRALSSAGYRFAGWTGACRGTGQCVVKTDLARSVRATFRRR